MKPVVQLGWNQIIHAHYHFRGRRGRDRMVVGFITTCAISKFTTTVVSSNPAHGEMYSM